MRRRGQHEQRRNGQVDRVKCEGCEGQGLHGKRGHRLRNDRAGQKGGTRPGLGGNTH